MIAYSIEHPATHSASPRPMFVALWPTIHIPLTQDESGAWIVEGAWEDYGTGAAQPTQADYLAWSPPAPEEPAPLTDVDIDLDRITKILAGHEAEAPQRITRLKAEVSLAMIGFAGFNPVSANAEGSRFVVHHASKIAAFNLAGGNVVAGQALYDEIAESTGEFPWLNQEMGDGQPKILSIFLTRLMPK